MLLTKISCKDDVVVRKKQLPGPQTIGFIAGLSYGLIVIILPETFLPSFSNRPKVSLIRIGKQISSLYGSAENNRLVVILSHLVVIVPKFLDGNAVVLEMNEFTDVGISGQNILPAFVGQNMNLIAVLFQVGKTTGRYDHIPDCPMTDDKSSRS